jgi:quinol monooxygenase YgiN
VKLSRRQAFGIAAVAASAATLTAQDTPNRMYGLIGRLKATPGKRDELAAILIEGSANMPGCLSYVVAKDPQDPDAIWVTEVWENEADHKASLALPSVRQAIKKGRPLIASFDERHITEPVGIAPQKPR